MNKWVAAPKRQIVHRASDTVVLECGHVESMPDRRRAAVYCFKCQDGKELDLLRFGLTREELEGWKANPSH